MSNSKTILIDNYDSFSYNLKHQIEEILSYDIDIVKNDQFDLNALNEYDFIILSPGPGLPYESGNIFELLQKYHDSKKILGICLGLQAIVEFYGGKLYPLQSVCHGIETTIYHNGTSFLVKDVPNPFTGGRYHSWLAERSSLPQCLEINCLAENGEIMGVEHKEFPVYGLQFHPESIMTPDGKQFIKNFLHL